MKSIEFNLLKIEVLDEYLPLDDYKSATIKNKYTWQCGFSFKIKKIAEGSNTVSFDISYTLHKIDNPEEKILNIKTRSFFLVKGELNLDDKLQALYKFIAISIWNHQGIYAAKTEGTQFDTELPPEANFNQFEEKFKNKLQMNGNKKIEHGIIEICFSAFYVHPDFIADIKINEKDFEWMLFSDFRIGERNSDWDYLTIENKIKLIRRYDEEVISELTTKSTFRVTAGMSFEYKFKIINLLTNITIGHLQGGWVIKQSNPNLKSFLPQAFFKENMIEDYLKKNVYERWD